MIIFCVLFLLLLIVLNKKNIISYKTSLIILCAAGVLIRIYYILNSTITTQYHDTVFHLEYIKRITVGNFNTENLAGIGCHPPLYYIICAIWVKIANVFTNNPYESLQILSFIINILTNIHILNIIKKCNIENIILPSIIIFLPTNITLSGFINNDILLILLSIIAIDKFISWCENKDTKTMIQIAICCSLGMLTKISMLLLIFSFVIVGLHYILINKINKKIIMQYLYFTIIVMLGMFQNILNLFNNKVFLKISVLNQEIYQNDIIYPHEIFIFNIKEIYSPFVIQYQENNYFSKNYLSVLFKTFIFDEFVNNKYKILAYLLLILITIMLIKGFINIIKSHHTLMCIFAKVYIIFSLFMQFYYILISPYLCTMNARYIYPQLIFLLIFAFLNKNKLQNNNK